MNQPAATKKPLWKTLLVWIPVSAVLITAVVWNIRVFQTLQIKQRQLANLQEIDKREQAKIDQLNTWEADADESFQTITNDHQALDNMYSQVRSPEDFFVVHPRQIAFTRKIAFKVEPPGESVRMILYVPQGSHRLGVTIATSWVNPMRQNKPDRNKPDPNAPKNQEMAISEASPVSPKPKTVWFENLEGGRTYDVTATVTANPGERAVVQIEMTGQETLEERLGEIDLGEGGSVQTGPSSQFPMPGQIKDDIQGLTRKIFYRNRIIQAMRMTDLVQYRRPATRRADGHSGNVTIDFALESAGSPKSLPINRSFHNSQIANLDTSIRPNPFKRIKYDDQGWYYIETADPNTN